MRKSRIEVKYLFPLERLEELFKYISPFMGLDEHAGDGASKAYKVQSIYYDTKDFDLFQNHREGYPKRRKVRMRKYHHNSQSQHYWEVKHKAYMLSTKLRLKLDEVFLKEAFLKDNLEEFYALFMERYRSAEDNDFLQAVNFDFLLFKIRPVVFISFDRIAFKSLYDYDVRLTVDYNVQSSQCRHYAAFGHTFHPKEILDKPIGILELKFHDKIPQWMQDILASFRLTRIAFSKYQKSVEKIYSL